MSQPSKLRAFLNKRKESSTTPKASVSNKEPNSFEDEWNSDIDLKVTAIPQAFTERSDDEDEDIIYEHLEKNKPIWDKNTTTKLIESTEEASAGKKTAAIAPQAQPGLSSLSSLVSLEGLTALKLKTTSAKVYDYKPLDEVAVSIKPESSQNASKSTNKKKNKDKKDKISIFQDIQSRKPLTSSDIWSVVGNYQTLSTKPVSYWSSLAL